MTFQQALFMEKYFTEMYDNLEQKELKESNLFNQFLKKISFDEFFSECII